MGAYLYILRCADASYYVGTTRDNLEKRIAEHNDGTFDGYTASRRPVVLAFQQDFEPIDDAVSAERQVKGWRREKKEALIRGDFAAFRDGVLRTPHQHEVYIDNVLILGRLVERGREG
jgi:predicted GIY-YIG superfamily endonuclease